MAKAEQSPPFKMKIENGHLVPAAAWDAERLASYRNGSEVNCVITQEVASWRRRKYWSILGKVVKTCPVRQKRAEDLHKAIRLKLGIVESFTTMSGATKVELRSTSLMDEQEFEAYYHEAMDLLRDVTGVDVETLHKESADVGRDETEQPEERPVVPNGSEGGGVDDHHPTDDSASLDQSASGGPEEGGSDAGATADEPSSDPVKRMLMEECVENMLRDAFSEPAIERPEKVDKLESVFLEPQNLGSHPHFVKLCAETARRIIGKPQERGRAREYLMGKIG